MANFEASLTNITTPFPQSRD